MVGIVAVQFDGSIDLFCWEKRNQLLIIVNDYDLEKGNGLTSHSDEAVDCCEDLDCCCEYLG
jgi:hypothetical protein